MSVAGLITVVLLILGAGSPVHAAAGAPGSVKFSLGAEGAIVVPVTIDGAGPFPFLLDTGSTRSFVTDELAERLAAPLVARTLVVTSAGSEMRPVAAIRRMAIATMIVDDILAAVVPAARLSAEHVGGILGQDALAGLNYTLDYRKRLFVWTAQLDAPPEGRRLVLRKTEGRYLVELQQDEDGGRIVRFVPDTGAGSVVVFIRPGFRPLDLQMLTSGGQLRGIVGERPVDRAVIRTFRIGAITWRDEPVVVVAREGTDAPEGDGLLPLHRFGRVTFNTRENYLIVEAR